MPGFDVSDLFQPTERRESGFSLGRSMESSISLCDNFNFLNKTSLKFKDQAEKDYEKTLKNVVKKERRVVDKKLDQLRRDLMNQTVRKL
jgi:hypothetical protein